ncbi:cysteine dioxygenase [Candidatus Poriferisodalis sp.]|uniref:cysteine dioxygenase n=1 Tax=Candidatus Poriferisodalis sp. TaxID=3101277 RepID=UPI003B523DB0
MSASDSAQTRAAERASAVADAMDDIAKIDAHGREHGGIDRSGIARIKERLLELATHTELFPSEDFPPPDGERGSFNYRLAQNDDDTLALYVQSVSTGTSAPPHEHTTWAVIVGMRGQELNRFYDCCAGEGEPNVEREEMVERGTGVAMLGHDIHSIHIEGASTNFHCYGLAMEAMTGRRYWSAEHGEWRIFSDVASVVEARPGYPTTAAA